MPLYEFFKNLFGISGNKQTTSSEGKDYRSQFLNPDSKSFEDSSRPEHDDTDSDNITRFNIFTDPLEMHRYFEEQMHEVLKSFGIFDHDEKSFFGFNIPALVEPPPETNLREHLLKPGYHSTKENKSSTDSDLDGKVHATDLDILLKNRSLNDESLLNKKEYLTPQVKTFGQSMTSKTIRRQDGSVETHRTVRDNAGNEETIVTRQIGDKQYTVTVRTDKYGRQEKVEDMKNIDDHELSHFTDNWRQFESPQIDINSDLNNWFEKLFK